MSCGLLRSDMGWDSVHEGDGASLGYGDEASLGYGDEGEGRGMARLWGVGWARWRGLRLMSLHRRVPLYSLSSLISLYSLDLAFFIDAFRDVYEVSPILEALESDR